MLLNRRAWLRQTACLLGAAPFAGALDRPEVTRPRATSGDTAIEPDWEERLTVTVGPGRADLSGDTDKVLQAAVDYVAYKGGGTVKVLPATFKLSNSVFLRSGVRLLGSGLDTILLKEPSRSTTLLVDSDWYDQEITLADADRFKVGDGVCLQTTNPHDTSKDVLKRTLVARSGNRFKLDRALRQNFWTDQTPTVSSLFPLLTAEEVSDIVIESITVDGNRENNDHLDGNYAGGLWFQDCSRLTFRDVTSRNNNGDGISFQICHDVLVERCHTHGNADLGIHPGSGAQRPVMRDNLIERNNIGLFFCWGVKYGLAENNRIVENATGISIGHRDNENLVRNNEVLRSGAVGVLFRPERGEGFTATGNRIEANRIVDSGDESGIGVDIQGVTSANWIGKNTLEETRGPASRTGIRLGAECGEIELVDNTLKGFATPIQDLRKA